MNETASRTIQNDALDHRYKGKFSEVTIPAVCEVWSSPVHRIGCPGKINQGTKFACESQSVTYHSGKGDSAFNVTRMSKSMSNLRAACKLTTRSWGCVRSSHQWGRDGRCLVHLPWANPSLYWSRRARLAGCRHRVHADALRSSLACFDWIVKRNWGETWVIFLRGS